MVQVYMDKVSIIVPIYGVEQYLPKCIDSLINQTYGNLEILLVDDGSKDCSGKLCDEYAANDDRVIALHKKNGGLTSARNYGLDHATGEWIMHVDGDDWLELNAVELLINKAIEDYADIVFADFLFDYSEKKLVKHLYDWNKQEDYGLREYITTTWTCLCGSIQRRALYDKYSLRSPLNINYCEDFHLIVRLCFFAEKVSKVSAPLYHYRQQESSIVHSLNKKTEADEQWVYADIIRFFKEQGKYEVFKECMAWRTLKGAQEMTLDVKTFDDFCAYNSDKNNYIFSCPYIGLKLKIISWCLTHGLKGIAALIVQTRNILRR